jgi:hypothetical protein
MAMIRQTKRTKSYGYPIIRSLFNLQSTFYSKYNLLNYSFFGPQASRKIDLTETWANENLLLGETNRNTGITSKFSSN